MNRVILFCPVGSYFPGGNPVDWGGTPARMGYKVCRIKAWIRINISIPYVRIFPRVLFLFLPGLANVTDHENP
jgi:hypothetical protein